MTPHGAGHPFQMADNTEIEVPDDWMALSSWQSTMTSAKMPRDKVIGTGGKDKLGIRPGSKEQGRWTVRAPTNTRALGNLVMVELRKGPSGGLGFSITTRDNLEGPNSPIYIKHILPDGAAIKDGRLRPGDRLLQVNDVMMTGKCLSDVTAILRNIEIDALSRIAVSRQMAAPNETKALPQIVIDGGDSSEDVGLKEDAPVCLRSASESTSSISISRINCDDRMQETLLLRVAHVGSAGSNQLGLKVKRSRRHNLCGLRVRSVITGGLADKDGQLQANDHLIEVNGISLADVDRSTAVDIFRSVLQRSVENLSAIAITIIRWKAPETYTSKLELMICDENIECLTLNTVLEEADDCDKRIIPFSNITREADVVECVSVDCLALVDHVVVFSSGKHSCDFFPDGNVLPQVEGQTPTFRENEVCTDGIKCSSHDDNSASAASSLESSDAVVQEKEEVDLKVTCFERQGFGRKSISEKRSSKELLSDSEVYRSIKEHRKRKDQMKPEISAGFHEATTFDRVELEFREDFEPAALVSNPQVSIPNEADPQGSLPGASTTLDSISDETYALGLLPGESNQQGSLPNQSNAHPVLCNPLESVRVGNVPARFIPHGPASHISDPRGSTLGPILHRSVPLRFVPPGSASQGSIRHESVSLRSNPNGSVPLGSFPIGSVPCESLPQQSVPPVPHGSVSHKFVPCESVPRGFIPSGSVPGEPVPLGSTPDVLMNACISNDLHVKRSTDVSTAAATVIGPNDSVVHSNSSSSSTSSQIPLETVSIASSSSTKPSKKFTASLLRKFFKKGFSDLFRSEAQTGSRRQFDEDKNEGIVKQSTPNNTLIRKDFSLPRLRSGRVDNDVISSSYSHPDLQQSYPNALRTVNPPNFYNPRQFLPPPPRFRAPICPTRNSFPVQFYRPNPYPFSTVLVRSHGPAIPTGFAICPTYVPLQRAAIQAYPIQGDRFLGPSVRPAQLSWVGFGQKFVNVQHIASQEPRMTNQ